VLATPVPRLGGEHNARTLGEDIVAGTAAQQVVAGTTGEGVVSGAAVKPVRGRLENVHGLRRFFSLICSPRGAKTGQERVNPVVYLTEGEDFVIFASKGGHPTNPDWYHNLVVNPDATIEVGTETPSVRVRVPKRDERDRYWTEIKERIAGFAEYEDKTDRVIPAVVLERV
jgi:deazaflavin-dependent oxidoreductase (nitroreductase family)